MIVTAISAAIIPYWIAVAPLSSLASDLIICCMPLCAFMEMIENTKSL